MPASFHIAVIGAGPAGLFAAETLARRGGGRFAVTVYDRMPSPGRKLLIAGRGGLNLTHAEPLDAFLPRYRGPAAEAVREAVRAFPPAELVAWANGLGQETFEGSSGRVFPRAMKASPLLRAWLRRLDGLGVRLAPRRRWLGWDADGALLFETETGARERVAADATLLALGGASWPRLGSDAAWTPALAQRGVAMSPFVPANCGFDVNWSPVFRERFAGAPVKGVALTHGRTRLRGEFVVTAHGVEGGAVYALSADMRDAIAAAGEARLYVDLKPDLREAELVERLAASTLGGRHGESLTNRLRKAAGLSPVAIGLVREACGNAPPPTPNGLARLIKGVMLRCVATRPLARAISSAGGVAAGEVDDAFMLRRLPGVFVAGEMLDWEAPTGGYLLQACFATGRAAATGLAAWLDARGAA